jgi:hypothetical protein
MKGIVRLLSICCLCCSMMGISASSNAQQIKIMVRITKCDQGKILHPIHESVTIFDHSKVPEIEHLVKELKNNLNPSDSAGIDKMLRVYGELQEHVRTAPALARSSSLPTSEHLFVVPSVRRVIVIAFGQSEFDPVTYAVREQDVSTGKLNNIELNFSSEEECLMR